MYTTVTFYLLMPIINNPSKVSHLEELMVMIVVFPFIVTVLEGN